MELEHPATTDQRAVDREERILRRCTNENHDAVLDVRQQDVLLGLVEAVDLVDEQQRLVAAHAQSVAGCVEHFAQILHAAGDGAQLDELRPAGLRQQMGERRLAGARRTVEQDRAQPIGREQSAEQLAFAEEVLLAGELLERSGPHPRGKWLRAAAIGGFAGFKQTHNATSLGDGTIRQLQ